MVSTAAEISAISSRGRGGASIRASRSPAAMRRAVPAADLSRRLMPPAMITPSGSTAAVVSAPAQAIVVSSALMSRSVVVMSIRTDRTCSPAGRAAHIAGPVGRVENSVP